MTMTKLKQTLTGELPDEWEVVRLDDVSVEITDGSHFSPKEDKNGKYLIATVANIKENQFDINSCKKISIEDYEKLVKNGCKPQLGDVLFSKDGTVGLSFSFKQNIDIVLLSSIAIIKPNEHLYPDYCTYVLKSPAVFRQIIGSKRGTGLRRIILKDLKRIKIPLPPLPEQRKIAQILSTIDDAIQKVGEAIAKIERLKQGLMQELLTRGIGHERFRDSEVGRIPDGWEVKEIGEISDSYAGGTPHRTNKNYYGGDIPWVKSGEVNQRHIYDTGEKITEEGLKNSSTKKVSKDTVLVAMYGATAGKAGILKIGGTTNQAVLAICPINNNFDYQFMYYLLSSKIHRFISMTQGTGQPNLSKKIIDNLKIPLPPLPEQRKIASILSTVDKKLELENKRKETLERVKTGLMSDLLAGKKRIKMGAGGPG